MPSHWAHNRLTQTLKPPSSLQQAGVIPRQQAEAANSLIAQGIDVITQHQDCTKTIIETAERAGVMSVGYHADASTLAPEGWIVGSMWDWGDLFVDIVNTIESGNWPDSPYDGSYRAGMASGAVKLAPFGKNVPQEVQDESAWPFRRP